MKRMLMILALAAAVGSTAAVAAQAPKPPDTVVLKGAPLGGVKFNHTAHVKAAGAQKCTVCHHPSKPEMPLKSPTQRCQDCHTSKVTAPMKTTAAMAFHGGPTAKAGTCVTCHMEQNKAGKKTPTKCNECHKKENV